MTCRKLVLDRVHLLEYMKPDEPTKKIYDFAFIMQPLELQGGTELTVAPLAVR
jgi:hypothetical protein